MEAESRWCEENEDVAQVKEAEETRETETESESGKRMFWMRRRKSRRHEADLRAGRRTPAHRRAISDWRALPGRAGVSPWRNYRHAAGCGHGKGKPLQPGARRDGGAHGRI